MEIKLSDHFNYKRLLRFTLPSIIMMVFTSIYGVVDGIFVSNFAGPDPFAAINIIMPFLMIFSTVGFMIGTGGSALIAKSLGEGNPVKAKQLFSLLIYVTIIFGVILALIGNLIIEPVSVFLGAKGDILKYCITYGRINLFALPFFMLQNAFQSFLITAEKPKLGLFITVAAGVTNIILDALLIAVFNLGLSGAAYATAFSQAVGGVVPLIYFIFPNSSIFKLGKTRFDGKALSKTLTNGSSEFMTNVSMSVVNMLYNFQLMKFAGDSGVVAYGVIMYVNFIFAAIFIGYSIGSAPIIGYHYGAANHSELRSLRKSSLLLIAITGCVMTLLAQLLANPLAKVFVGYDQTLFDLTVRAFRICSVSFLFFGFSIFGSSFFTALNNGLISAVISFFRIFLFQCIALLVLPVILKINGVWLSVTVAEIAALLLTASLFIGMKKKYKY